MFNLNSFKDKVQVEFTVFTLTLENYSVRYYISAINWQAAYESEEISTYYGTNFEKEDIIVFEHNIKKYGIPFDMKVSDKQGETLFEIYRPKIINQYNENEDISKIYLNEEIKTDIKLIEAYSKKDIENLFKYETENQWPLRNRFRDFDYIIDQDSIDEELFEDDF